MEETGASKRIGALETIARSLASGMSRREALRAGGAAIAGAIALSPQDAWAAVTGACPRGRVRCRTTCCPVGEVCLGTGTKAHCACPNHKTRCNGQCVQLATNAKNCGRCGHACAAGQTCSGGRCHCPTGETVCAGACVNLTRNHQHCGSCGHACTSNQVCESGACVTPCGPAGATCSVGSCCTGLVCDQSSQKCTAQPSCIGNACSSTCCPGAVCDNVHAVHPACRMPTGGSCNVDNDCGVEDYCAAGVCTTAKMMRGSGAYCDDVDDCLTSLTCDTTDNVCCAGQGQACPAGVSCCAGFTCIQGTCAPSCLSEGTACPGATPCCGGLTCIGGVCTAPCIQSGGDCSTRPNDCCSGLACSGGGTCQPI